MESHGSSVKMANLIVLPEAMADVQSIGRIIRAAFGRDTDRWLEALRASTAWRDLSFVAEIGGQVIGHVAFTRAWIDTPHRLVEVLMFSPMSVTPAF